MRFLSLFDSYVDNIIRSDPEAHTAIEEFKRNIPTRVLQLEFDISHSNKQGITDGRKVYKLGLNVNDAVAFIEYYDDRDQGQPTMAIFAERNLRKVAITGWQINKQLHVSFAVCGGAVKKSVQIV